MPLYEFACIDCEQSFELLIRGNEKPRCPTCDGTHLEKLLSAPVAHATGRPLPMSQARPDGGCGRPQCGMGHCAGLE
jgi:putative FmdB family regulatory protein